MQVSAASGVKVTLIDQSTDVLKKALTGIETNLGKIAKKKFADAPEVSSFFITLL